MAFSLTCVCVSLCAKKFVSGYLRNMFTDLNENFGVCCNWPRIVNVPKPVQSDQCFPHYVGRGLIFAFL